jgi:allantoinase
MRQKGGIAIGNDADFCLIDLNAGETITTGSLHYRHQQSPYVGRNLRSRVRRTFLRGQTIFEDGKFAARPMGRLVRPERS